MKYHSKNYQIFKTGIFKLSPHVLALMKNKAQNEGIYYLHFAKLNGMVWLSEPMLYAQKSSKLYAPVRVEEMDCLEMCVQKRNVELLKSMLHTSVVHMGLPKAYEYAMKHKLTHIQEALLDYTCESKVTHIISFAESAIVYNQPKTLDKILSHSTSMQFEPASYCKLSDLCTVLMNDQCKRILQKHGLFQNVDISSDEQFFELIHKLDPFYDEFRIEIKVFLTIHLKLFPKDCSELLFKCLTVQPVRINAVKILLDLGARVNYRDHLDNTPIIHMLYSLRHFSPTQYLGSARRALELLVYENPDLEFHKTAVYHGIQEDARRQSLKHKKEMIVNGTYKTDAKEHGLFGHDGNSSFALNFIGPFLLECGFPVSRDVLLESLERPLHPAEHGFIKDFLDCPRSLKSHCRNALRNYFKGRDIYNFITTAGCPEKLKEFVLLETVCLCR